MPTRTQQKTSTLGPNFALAMQTNSFYNDSGKHYICYYIIISLITDTQAEIVYIDTLLFCSDVAIHFFDRVYVTHFRTATGVGVAFPQ